MTLRGVKHYLKNPVALVKRVSYWLYELRHPDEPWLEPRAVRVIESLLHNQMKIFEWGSGRSTLWFCKRVGHVTSIEYNQDWYQKVKEMLEEGNCNNVDLRFIALEHPKNDPTPKHYPQTPKYVDVIHQFSQQEFDMILIDGHYRLTCADHCLDHLKVGGYLVIDNSNRVADREEWGIPSHWSLIHETENVVTQTSVWRKEPMQ